MKIHILLFLMLLVPVAHGQGLDFDTIELETVELGEGLYVLMGGPAQGNVLVSIGNDGIFLVDTMYGPMHEKIMAALVELGDQPVRYVVNTHMHGDHTAGNEAMVAMGAVVIGHENLRTRLIALEDTPAERLPVRTYSDRMTLYFNGRADRNLQSRPSPYRPRFDHLLQGRQRHARWRHPVIAPVSQYRRQ